MDVANFHLEKMLPDLKELLEKKAFTEEQVTKIIEMRKKYEFRIHRRICLESDYDQYIKYEKSVEVLRSFNTKDIEYKFTRCDRSINKRIIALYSKLCYRFPTLENHMDYVEWLIKNKMTNQASQELLKSVQLFPSDPLPYLKSAEFEMFNRQNHMGAKAILMRGIRHLCQNVSIYIGFIKLEAAFLQKVAQRQQLLDQDELEFDNVKQKDNKVKSKESHNISDYANIFYIIFQKTKELAPSDIFKFINALFPILDQVTNIAPIVVDIKEKITLECFKLFGEFEFKSKVIQNKYGNTTESFIACTKEYESESQVDEMFIYFQKWLISVVEKEPLAQQYIFELIKNDDVQCCTDIYQYGATQGLVEASQKLNFQTPSELLSSEMDWKIVLGILNKHEQLEADLIPQLLNKYVDLGYEHGELVFEVLSNLFTNEENIKLVLEFPRLRMVDVNIAIQNIYECSDATGAYLLKVVQENKNVELWKHVMGIVKPYRHLYLKAAVKCATLVN